MRSRPSVAEKDEPHEKQGVRQQSEGPQGPVFDDSQTSRQICEPIFGAGNEARTRDPNLGKVVLYH